MLLLLVLHRTYLSYNLFFLNFNSVQYIFSSATLKLMPYFYYNQLPRYIRINVTNSQKSTLLHG